LIFLKAATRGCRHDSGVSQKPTIAERLLAHAKFCREIARGSWSEEIARNLERLAEDCTRAAQDANPTAKRT
jgi:hypothetical protein